jgi:hypothetical protein
MYAYLICVLRMQELEMLIALKAFPPFRFEPFILMCVKNLLLCVFSSSSSLFALFSLKSHYNAEEQQETSNKHQQQNCENNKTGIKTETLDIKEENKLMTTEDVSEKLGTITR